jgi:hypothetical protein
MWYEVAERLIPYWLEPGGCRLEVTAKRPPAPLSTTKILKHRISTHSGISY